MDRIEFKAQLSVSDAGEITGIAWPFSGPDRVGDVIERGAFKALPPLPMLDTHDQTKAVGVWDEITETAEGLTVKGRLLVDDVERAREVRALVRAGALRGLSIGFASKKAMPRRGGGRTISDLELLEISVVAVPAHPGARITSAKGHQMTEQTETPDIAALEAKMTEIEKKADTSGLAARLDKIEAKMNRPGADAKPEGGMTAERKAFAAYLYRGDAISDEDKKALVQSTNPTGGYLAPPEMSSEIIRDLIEVNPIRAYASVMGTTATSTIYPVRGDLTNAKWVGETQTREESEITFGQKEIAVKELSTFVELSNRLMADAPQAEAEVRLALAEDFGKKEAHGFLWGEGVLEPSGLMVDPDIASTANGHATALSTDALITLLYTVPASYRSAGVWVMNGLTLSMIRRMKDGQGNYLWQPSYQAGQPETILGRPVVEMVDMPDVEADAFPILYGDFKAYRILDRAGLDILVDPYTRRVNGMSRIHASRRVGGGVLQAARFRKLKMAVS